MNEPPSLGMGGGESRAIGEDNGVGHAGSGGSGKSLAKFGADPALPGNNIESIDEYYYSYSQTDYERERSTWNTRTRWTRWRGRNTRFGNRKRVHLPL